MSKNLTRKGLALGAAVALGSTLFAGTPAQAADLLTLTPSAGTTYSTLSTSVFTLAAGFDSSISAAADDTLKYNVVNSTQHDLNFDINEAGADATPSDVDPGTSTNSDDTEAATVVFGNSTPAIGSENSLEIGTDERTDSFSITVQAFLDTDGDNLLDTGEVASAIRTVTFVDSSKVTATVSLTTPVIGADSLVANVSLDNEINLAQVASGDVLVVFDKDSTKIPGFASNTTSNASATVTSVGQQNGQKALWSADDAALVATFTPDKSGAVSGVDAYDATAATYGAKAYLAIATATPDVANPETDATKYVQSGVRSSKVVATGTTGVITIKAAAAAGIKNVSSVLDAGGTANVLTSTTANGTATVRKGVKTFNLEVFIGDTTATAAAVPSVPVSITVTPTNLTAADGVTVNGKAVSTAAKTIEATTNSSGKVTIAVTTLTGNADDALRFTVNAQGVTTSNGATDYTATWTAAAYTFADSADLTGAALRSITSGSTYTINYKVADQWGDAPADGTTSISVVDTSNSGRTTGADFTVVAPVVAGKAAVSIKDNGVGLGNTVVTATLNADISTVSVSGTLATTVNVVADATPKTVTLKDLTYGSGQDKTKALVLSEATFANYDNRFDLTATAPAPTDATKITLAGTVANAAGVAVAGTPVTVSATGFLFGANNSYGLNSITVLTDAAGEFSVGVWSQAGGAQTVKIAAGAATASKALTYAAGTGTAKTLVFAPVSKTSAGRAIDLTAYANDKYGNAAQSVVVSYTATGVGYLSTSSATTTKSGATTAKLIVGNNETGIATVTASVTDADGATVEITRTILVGVSASIVKSATSSAVVKNALGGTIKIVRGTKSATKVATSNKFKVSLKGGTGTVKVYVNGIKVASK